MERAVKHLELQRDSIVRNWENSGLLDGLKGYRKDNIAQLFEAQASCLLNEVEIQPVTDTFKTKKQP